MLQVLVVGLILFGAESQAVSISERLSMIHHEPPVRNQNQSYYKFVKQRYITQPVDHFNHQDNRTYRMRYLQNDVHFRSGGPVFIFIGGEWEIGPGHISKGQHIYDLAREFRGLLIYTEHRFYGETWPIERPSVADLRYLSIDHALADLANFVQAITSDTKLNATGGVIVVGCSYSATMATWFRQKYPHLVNGAWASSAPLHAKLNNFEYTETVGKSMRALGGDKCYATLDTAFKALDDLLARKDLDKLLKVFGLCETFKIDSQMDVWNFFDSVAEIFEDAVQGHSSGCIESYCEKLIVPQSPDDENPELNSLGKLYRDTYGIGGCIVSDYERDVRELQLGQTPFGRQFRSWIYQTCSEFAWYQTTDSTNHPFGTNIPIAYFLQRCKDIYGDVFEDIGSERNVNHTNVIYGGFSPAVTNVYSTHGSLDPWHPMGVLTDINEHSPTVVIKNISHCYDLDSISSYDSEQLINSKKTIRNLVKKWLNL